MNLIEKQNLLVEELGLIPNEYERLSYLVDYGKRLEPLDENLKINEFKIEGCLSQLWIIPKFKDKKCVFKSQSDSAIVNGIAGLICNFYSNQFPDEILSNNAEFLDDVGINQHLSPNRRNGLSKVIQFIHHFASSCKVDKNN